MMDTQSTSQIKSGWQNAGMAAWLVSDTDAQISTRVALEMGNVGDKCAVSAVGIRHPGNCPNLQTCSVRMQPHSTEYFCFLTSLVGSRLPTLCTLQAVASSEEGKKFSNSLVIFSAHIYMEFHPVYTNTDMHVLHGVTSSIS